MKSKNLKRLFGFSVLMFVAFLSFTSVANAQYVNQATAIQRLKAETKTDGNFKQQGILQGTLNTSKVPAAMQPIDYAKLLRLSYVNELLNNVNRYGNVGTAIDANHTLWSQKLTGQTARAASLPILKTYVIDLLKL